MILRRVLSGCVIAGAAVCGAAVPAHAQLGDGGFVPALAPHTMRQAPLLNVGYSAADGGSGAVARGDVWFGRVGAAAAIGAGSARRGSVGALLEIVPQGVGLWRPGVQLQGAVAAYHAGGATDWSVPVALGVFLHAPIPLPNRAHVLVQPALSIRHVVTGSDDVDGTSGGVGVRAVFTDRAGLLTNWGAHGFLRLAADGADRGPRWEVALTRVLRRGASQGG